MDECPHSSPFVHQEKRQGGPASPSPSFFSGVKERGGGSNKEDKEARGKMMMMKKRNKLMASSSAAALPFSPLSDVESPNLMKTQRVSDENIPTYLRIAYVYIYESFII